MDTEGLSAKYICGISDKSGDGVGNLNDERLRMALHVYEAMPTVRSYLIKAIFKAAGQSVAEKRTGVQLGFWEEGEGGVYFWTEDTGELYVFATLERRKGGALWLNAGVCVDDEKLIEAQRDEVRERFELKVDPKAWSDSGCQSSGVWTAWAWVDKTYDKHQGCWHDDGFLRRAILNRDEVVSDVAALLMRIYDGMFVQET